MRITASCGIRPPAARIVAYLWYPHVTRRRQGPDAVRASPDAAWPVPAKPRLCMRLTADSMAPYRQDPVSA